MSDPTALAAAEGFAKVHVVLGRSPIADLYPQSRRCGIYALFFADGAIYVGQSVDVTRRFVEHRKNHPDIERIAFKPVARKQLDDEEQRLIQLFEREGHRSRGIVHLSVVEGERDFDLVMSRDEQERWLGGLSLVDGGGPRVEDTELRYRYDARFQQFLAHPYANEVIEVLNYYVMIGLPAIRRGEISFWNSTCMPTYNLKNTTIYSRINVNAQEVCTAAVDRNSLFFTWHLARSPLERFPHRKFRNNSSRGTVRFKEHRYAPGGQNQIAVTVEGVSAALSFLAADEVREAIRTMNLMLMRKGPALNKGNHCLALADRIIPNASQDHVPPPVSTRREKQLRGLPSIVARAIGRDT